MVPDDDDERRQADRLRERPDGREQHGRPQPDHDRCREAAARDHERGRPGRARHPGRLQRRRAGTTSSRRRRRAGHEAHGRRRAGREQPGQHHRAHGRLLARRLRHVWSGSTSSTFAGQLDEVAVYPRVARPRRDQGALPRGRRDGRRTRRRAASFTAAPGGLDVAFSAATSSDDDGSITAYSWTFGDGSTATGSRRATPTPRAGTYPVVLTVTDDSAPRWPCSSRSPWPTGCPRRRSG